jgi:hypothetical protein
VAGRPALVVWRSAALEPDSGLSMTARLAACVYCEHANGSGVLDPAPSAGTVADRMGAVERTARQARRELEDAGWLEVERRPGWPSRIVLRPLQEVPGSDRPTPARTPARTPASGADELENQRTKRAGAPEKNESKNGPDSFSKVLERVAAAKGGEDL